MEVGAHRHLRRDGGSDSRSLWQDSSSNGRRQPSVFGSSQFALSLALTVAAALQQRRQDGGRLAAAARAGRRQADNGDGVMRPLAVLWKVVEKVLITKPKGQPSSENKSTTTGVKWSFSPGTNLPMGNIFKMARDSKQKLNEFMKELKTFRSVDLSGHNFGDDRLFFLAESLAFNQSAEDVDFSGNGITAAGLKAFDGVLQANTVLKTLNLSGNAIGDEGAKYLSDILMGNSGIQKLQLNSTGISDEGAKAIAELLKKNSTLRVLELNNNMIEFAELHLHGNNMGNEGVRALVSGLSAHKGKITLLDLGNNDIGPKGAFHVANYIKKTKSLLWLNLYMNDIGDEGGNNIHASGVSEIAQVLKDNSIITTLELGYNPIGPDGAKALCEIIKFHGKLETLKLGWCQIGAKGVEYVADALKYNTTLSTLDLRANGLGDDVRVFKCKLTFIFFIYVRIPPFLRIKRANDKVRPLWHHPNFDPQFSFSVGPVDHDAVMKALARALEMKEEAYVDKVEKALDSNPELTLMGSCVLVMLIKDQDVYLMNLGDSHVVLA
ncbi:hypothetical protein IEQ34_009562 [Dendrobium chrysotoxum]|uniref:protein-serine/threonine phosphatase n=1 Tax=Dendrobium chrysotoxum TaxID=161865 RepID=A0AAV7H2E0_DENCH|nr:hypothetical protein IEQ34_009562 [Dendrobium chrysotoxum]